MVVQHKPYEKMRRCNHKLHKGERYLPVEEFYTAGWRNGKRQYGSFCKTCDREDSKLKYHAAKARGEDPNDRANKKKWMRARSRALTRLRRLYPEMFEKLLAEELMKE